LLEKIDSAIDLIIQIGKIRFKLFCKEDFIYIALSIFPETKLEYQLSLIWNKIDNLMK